MLEQYVTPGLADRLRGGIFGDHVETFCGSMVDLKYQPSTIRHKLWTVSCLQRWMQAERVKLEEFDERLIDRMREARRRRGRVCRNLRTTLSQLLCHLRACGAVARPVPPTPTEMDLLLAPYEQHLRRERGLAECTTHNYSKYVREFVADRFDEHPKFAALRSQDVRDFCLKRMRTMVPKRAQFMGSALRSFLRFLFLHGETTIDLSLALLTVRSWRLVGVPAHISSEEAGQLLCSCDRSSGVGRRDYAILLLLARLGLRGGEVVALELGDLHWRDGEIHVRGKGLVRDRLPLLVEVGEALVQYLQHGRPTSECRRVFLRQRAPYRGLGHPSTVSTIVARALDRAGLTPAQRGAHLLRHSLATEMIRHGASMSEIGQVLRHRSPNTTEIYAKVDFDALRDVAMPWPTSGGAA